MNPVGSAGQFYPVEEVRRTSSRDNLESSDRLNEQVKMADLESKIEKECQVILRTDSEEWDKRNKAMLNLTVLIAKYETSTYQVIVDQFTTSVFRLLKDPIKSMINDLRSQQVRDTCLFLMKLAEITKDLMKYLLREIFQTVLDGIKVPNKVMSGFVDNCIIHIIKHTTFKSGLPVLISELKENKAKFVRERCLDYINDILLTWDVSEKEADSLLDSIKNGLEDASVKAREISRLVYLNLFQVFPKKAEKIKSQVSPALRSRLAKAEIEHLKHGAMVVAANEVTPREIVTIESVPETIDTASVVDTYASTDSIADNTIPNDSSVGEVDASNVSVLDGVSITPSRKVPLRVRRQSLEDGAVTSIQAIIRGKLSRRQSISNNSGKESPESVGTGNMAFNNGALSPSPIVELIESAESVTIPSNTENSISPMISPMNNTWKVCKSEPVTPQFTLDRTPPVLSKTPPTSAHKLPTPSSTSFTSRFPSAFTSPGHQYETVPSLSINSASPVITSSDDALHAITPSHLSVGLEVKIKNKEDMGSAIIRFIGETSFSPGCWVGLELHQGGGKNNGIVNDVQYFTCDDNRGLFVRPSQVEAIEEGKSNPAKNETGNAEKLVALVKYKISNLMDILNQQLNIVEEHESNRTMTESNVSSTVQSLLEMGQNEIQIIEKYNEYFRSLS